MKHLRDIRFPNLGAEEEYELAKRWRADHDDEEAHYKLVASHLKLVRKIAKSFLGYEFPLKELESEGTAGLVRALKKFDPDNEEGARFATWATPWIVGAIQQYILRSYSQVKIGTTDKQKKLFWRLREAKRLLPRQPGLKASWSEQHLLPDEVTAIAQSLGVKEKDVRDMDSRFRRDWSINTPVLGDDGKYDEEWWLDRQRRYAREADQETRLLEGEKLQGQKAALREGLAALTVHERRILEALYLSENPSTLDELAAELGISRPRVSQIKRRALEKLLKIRPQG
jgi:RNA polymerase sigma-32 factor